MKLGCAVGCFTYPHYSAPYERPIQKIGELGFDGIELIAAEKDDLWNYYTSSEIAKLKNMVYSYGMEVSQFVLYAPLVTNLMERNQKSKQEAYDVFKRGITIAREFGTDKITIVSNWPNELIAPIPYVPCYFHPNTNGVEQFEPKLKMFLPSNYDAKGAWENYIDSLQVLTEMCEREDMYLCLEGHANTEVGTTDGFLRAADRIKSNRFCTNFDTAWQLIQREWLPWSVYKLGDKIKHVHLRDGDGMLCYSMPPGMGIIDWNSFVRALKEVGYNGYLSFELAGYKDPDRYLKQAKEYMMRVLEDENA
jgi:sugar phosphate isomerase/epimerase